MIKKNSLLKLAVIAVFMAIIATLVFILPRLGMPIKTYAETSASLERAQASVNTFKNMRQSAIIVLVIYLAGITFKAYAETKSDFKENL